jgi:hypothetical protein
MPAKTPVFLYWLRRIPQALYQQFAKRQIVTTYGFKKLMLPYKNL